MRRALAAVSVTACALVPAVAQARAAVAVSAGTVVFFSDTLALIGRNGATVHLVDGTRASADALFVDLKADRVVLAGRAHIVHGANAADADAIALDLDSGRVDLLSVQSGVVRTTQALTPGVAAEIDAQRFAFPDVNDRYAFIRSKRALVTPHANVRFTPASFPTSVGGLPVPTYLYTFATAAGFGATTLPGANFDQPYGITGTPTSLTTIHGRWEDSGPAVALQEQLASGDTAYATAGYDAPLRSTPSSGFNAYTRLGSRYTFMVDGNAGFGYRTGDASLGAAFGNAGGRISYHIQNGGYSSFDASLRSPDEPLFGGATLRLTVDLGYDAQRGGYLYPYDVLPDAHSYATVWRHGVDTFLATPILHAPFRTTVGFTLDASRTWYAFPHHYDAITATASATKKLSPSVSLFGGYQNTWSAEIFPGRQSQFYPYPLAPLIAPDGTPYYGWYAYNGAAVGRYENLDAQYAPPAGSTSVRVSLRHADDFFQFDGLGRPLWEIRTDIRFRPFPNVGLALGRSYDFGWGGMRWVPGWSLGITP